MTSSFLELLRLVASDPDLFSRMVHSEPSIMRRTGPHEETLLHWFAIEGRCEAVERLAQLGAEIDSVNEFGNTPLMDCSQLGDTVMVSLLLKLGANPNFQSPKDKNTALHLAAESGRADVVSILALNGGDVQMKNVHGETVENPCEFYEKWVKPRREERSG